MRRRAYTLLFCLIILHAFCYAQTAQVQAPPDQKAKAPAAKSDVKADRKPREIDPLIAQRRMTAVSLLTSLADDARSFRAEGLRARVQARAADALWDTDKERARSLFRRAWEAAETADAETGRRINEERRAAETTRKSSAHFIHPNLQGEILRLAARRDRKLGEEFLVRIDADKGRDDDAPKTAEANNQLPCPAPTEPLSPAIAQRLTLARTLLSTSEAERAMQFAEPALRCPSTQVMAFLSELRTKNAVLADANYSNLLARATTDAASDANTVSLLASYAFSPFLYVQATGTGGIQSSQTANRTAPPDLPAPLRANFFRVAAQILLRPFPAPEQDKTSSGRVGTYFIIARLLPLFEQYAPTFAPALHAQQSALAGDAPERFRSGKERWLTEGLVPESSAQDETADVPDQIKNAHNASERDEIYANTAGSAVHTDYARARELMDKIEDTDLRDRVHAFIDFMGVRRALDKKDADEVIRLARTGQLTDIQRVRAFTGAAQLLAKTNPSRAQDMIDEARTAARRIDASDSDRARALVSIATHLLKLNRAQSWDTLAEAIKSANAAADFTGEDGQIAIRLQTKNGASEMSNSISEFDLSEIFGALSEDDLNRAIELARTFSNEAPRASATLAIARNALDEKRTKKAAR